MALVVFSLTLLAAAYLALGFCLADKDLRDALAEADRLDPGWRFDELEARRKDLPEEQNSALRVLGAYKLLPTPWSWSPASSPWLETSLREVLPGSPLDGKQIEIVAEALRGTSGALAEARRLKDLPNGRYPFSFDSTGLPNFGAHNQAARQVTGLLSYDVLQRESTGDMDGALESCRAIVNVARSFGDTPDFFGQIKRLEIREIACQRIERTIGQGQSSERCLAAVQALLQEEEGEPVFLIGARGFRANMDQMAEIVQNVRPAKNVLQGWAFAGLANNVRPAALSAATRTVEIAKRPLEELEPAVKDQFRADNIKEVQFLARTYVLPRLEKISRELSTSQVRSQAELRCTIAALAAERHRRAHGSWPPSLAALVPDYLETVPLDPYDGQPMRFRQLFDGVVIYSIGPDRQDHDGKLDHVNPGANGTDVGVQLWDVDRRVSGHEPRLDSAGQERNLLGR
jgi:hypothetical protein